MYKSRQYQALLIGLVLVIATLAAYAQVMDCDFIAWDDGEYVIENPHVKAGLTAETLSWALKNTDIRYWHPLTWISHMVDFELYGLDPMGHHWTNLLFHLANTLLIFIIFQNMTGALWESALLAALFSLHPLHVESVAWVAERKDVLSAFFGLLTILAYSRYVKTKRRYDYILVFLFFSLGLMAKPTVVTFPFTLLLLDFWPLKRIRFSCSDKKTTFIKVYRLILEKAPLFLLSALSSLVTFVAQQNVGLIKHFPLEVRISNALISYIKYIGKTVWPQNLAVMYPHPGDSTTMIQTLGAALLILGFAMIAVRSAKRYPYISFGYFWYLGTFIPMIGLIQAGEHAMADRHTYIPLIGLFIIFAWGFSDLSRKWHYRKSILVACSAIVLSVLTAATFFQVGYWKNSITLFEHALNVTDNNCLVHNDLAAVLADEGRLDDAVHHYRSAIRIWPEYAKAHKGLADILFTQRKDNEALLHYNNALTLQPDYLEGYSNLAQLHYARGEYQKAASYLGKALDIDSEKDWLHSNMALVLTAWGKYDKAVIHFREALRLNPKDAETYFKYGTLLHKLDQRQSALATFAESIRIKPDYAEAYHKIGIIFVEEGKPAEAKRFFKRAIQLKPEKTRQQPEQRYLCQ